MSSSSVIQIIKFFPGTIRDSDRDKVILLSLLDGDRMSI